MELSDATPSSADELSHQTPISTSLGSLRQRNAFNRSVRRYDVLCPFFSGTVDITSLNRIGSFSRSREADLGERAPALLCGDVSMLSLYYPRHMSRKSGTIE